ncbi:FtsK/SpoIIIE domain-containing protein [Streptomyces roseoviridis]|uniref:FtsK/SpoIIIE domain-containing protein n=1 Tax=Streptomyces roseoviridis TaxID=67361 RepID=A0ABV5QSR7_9ACTN
MQIRLTVLAPHAGHGVGRACDVLVTAPAGTELAAVASSLAAAVSGPDTPASSGATVLYAGGERLDTRRCLLGEPPLVDGAVLSLQVPGAQDGGGEDAPARLHVVAGPDAGGVHLLHGGAIRIGRSVDADVPLDDPDVSRSHCTVTVGADGRVTVTDEGSTNGTTLDGVAVGPRPVRFPPGSVLRVGESALRLTGPGTGSGAGPGGSEQPLPTAPDGEGHLRVTRPAEAGGHGLGGATGAGAAAGGAWDTDTGTGLGGGTGPGAGSGAGARTSGGAGAGGYAPPHETAGASDATHGGGHGARSAPDPAHGGGHARAEEPGEAEAGIEAHSRTRQIRRRGLGAWARRLAGGREETASAEYGVAPVPAFAGARPDPASGAGASPDTWPDPAAVLLTALGPGPRLWERDLDHPEALVVRLGTTDRAELSGVPVTVGLREAGSLGLAGPAPRLAGLARSVVAQLAALHSPGDLEIVLVSADRNRPLDERRRAWGWLGWLPHVRPAHGQDCRLLLAYDRDQAQARLTELTRRLDDGPLGPGWASADRAAVAEAAARHEGPATVVVLDGDPGSAALRETAARLAGAGAAAGIHLICLAEAPSASPASPVAATYEEACAASFAFRECGAAALLSGDVATALRLLRTVGGRAAGHGTVGVVDAVSAAWADRFGRALAPLRTETAGGTGQGRAAAALPPAARLLDELGLARATPASLMARWASSSDGTAVLGAGPRGPVAVDLTKEGPHLLIEGPAGSGRTELLRSVAASLAAGGRPDRLGLLLVDGAGGERGEGLAACTELPHVTEHLVASDPVRMREFAQALGAELKRRAELLGDSHFADRRSGRLIGQRTASPAESLPAPARVGARIPDARTGASDLDGTGSGRTGRSPAGTAVGAGAGGSTAAGAGGGSARPGSGPASGPDSGHGSGSRGDRTPPPGSDLLGDRPSGRTLHVAPDGAVGDTPSGRLPRPAATPLTDRTPAPGSDLLGDRPSGRAHRPGPAPSTDRTPTPGTDLLGDRPSGRTYRTPSGAVYDPTGGPSYRSTPPPGSDLLAERPSSRTLRADSGRADDRGDLPDPGEPGHRAGSQLPGARSGPPAEGAGALPRLVVLVDDFDALVAPPLGAPGRPAAGSVVRALEAVARHGARLGVHLVATSARPDRTADTELAHGARLRIVLDAPPAVPGPEGPQPGRGRLGHPDGRVTPFQGGRVTGRIPRTATLRPTVVPLEWERMGDPPTRRPVRELGNGPTDLALLASALDRAARSVEAAPVPPLTSPTHA